MIRSRLLPLAFVFSLAGLAALGSGGCQGAAAASVIDTVLGAARKTFLGAATENYGDKYRDDFDKLLTIMTAQMAPKPADPAPPPAGAPQPGGTPPAGGAPPAGGTPPPVATDASGQPPPAGAPPVAGAPSPGVPLELEVVLLREAIVDGRSVPVPVADGETLRDPFGADGKGDNLKISFRTNADCYVYVISVDSTALAQPVFPSSYSGHVNPAKGGRTYQIPEGPDWITLDSFRGVENLYFLATRTQRVDLENQLVALAAHVREDDPRRAVAPGKENLVALASVKSDAPIARGLGRVRKSSVAGVQSSEGRKFEVDTQVFGAKGSGDIVVSRWFRHE